MAPGPDLRARFLEALAQKPLVLDAALGTRLIAQGLKMGREEPGSWNLSRPELVREIHNRDVMAGADAVLTNTFGANRTWLERIGLAEDLEAINRQAVVLAREAAGPGRFVIGSIGPTAASVSPSPILEASRAEIEQATLLAESGVDALLLETNVGEGRPGARVQSLREATGLPILYSLYSWQDGIRELVDSLLDGGVAAMGCNCRVGMAEMVCFAESFGPLVGDLPLLVKPGAGLPGDPWESPESFALAVPVLLKAGVRLFGGCCGSTEAHIAALRSALDVQRKPEGP